jgi:Flp pilus assembly protein TadG
VAEETVRTSPERRRAAGESGQAIVEFCLALPLVALLLGVGFNGWNSMDLSVQLTSAARAGAIQAANDLGTNPTATQKAADDATAAVNAEQGTTNVYQDTDPSAGDYVSVTEPPTQTTTAGTNLNVVVVTITTTPVALVPFIHSLSITASATARYS